MNLQHQSKYKQYPEMLSSTKPIKKKSENVKFNTRKPCQSDLDSLIVELKLPKNKSKVLIDFFKKRNLTDGQVLSTSHRKRNYKFASYFERNVDIVHVSNFNGLLNELKINYISNDWYLFMGCSTKSFKAILKTQFENTQSSR
ncbi:hypothetical protein A3Q56_02700 [Intoshia linei]|uniref:Uncharacterized protein n=1 Tax=Intoshia linei TaxID=1819745 RepID=A0A177B5L2_9BILA|nr:hypothetical protein A3Q56_02700 [Intoshia linei]